MRQITLLALPARRSCSRAMTWRLDRGQPAQAGLTLDRPMCWSSRRSCVEGEGLRNRPHAQPARRGDRCRNTQGSAPGIDPARVQRVSRMRPTLTRHRLASRWRTPIDHSNVSEDGEWVPLPDTPTVRPARCAPGWGTDRAARHDQRPYGRQGAHRRRGYRAAGIPALHDMRGERDLFTDPARP